MNREIVARINLAPKNVGGSRSHQYPLCLRPSFIRIFDLEDHYAVVQGEQKSEGYNFCDTLGPILNPSPYKGDWPGAVKSSNLAYVSKTQLSCKSFFSFLSVPMLSGPSP
jgi:hypothetical protein